MTSKQEMQVSGAWTQNVAYWLHGTGGLTAEQLEDLGIDLLALRYSFTRISPDTVIRALVKYGWQYDKEPIQSVLSAMVDERMDSRQVSSLLAILIPLIWRAAALRETAEGVTLKLMRLLKNRYDFDIITGDLERHSAKMFGLDVISASAFRQILIISKTTVLGDGRSPLGL